MDPMMWYNVYTFFLFIYFLHFFLKWYIAKFQFESKNAYGLCFSGLKKFSTISFFFILYKSQFISRKTHLYGANEFFLLLFKDLVPVETCSKFRALINAMTKKQLMKLINWARWKICLYLFFFFFLNKKKVPLKNTIYFVIQI